MLPKLSVIVITPSPGRVSCLMLIALAELAFSKLIYAFWKKENDLQNLERSGDLVILGKPYLFMILLHTAPGDSKMH